MSTTRGYEPLTPQGAATAGIGGRLLGCGCCCCISVVFAIYAVALGYVTIEVNKEFVEMPGGRTDKYCRFGEDAVSPLNVTFSIWWPGCGRVSSMDNFSTGCGEPCYDEQTMIDMQEMMSTLPFKKVRYSSRPNNNWDTVELGGWWLPADEEKFPSPRPRMVVQHGFTSNSNKARQMFVAYILRSIGFDVLVNNFRDHCLSGDSKLKFYQWGYAYPYDTLGAWDYAKDDPDGLLGGAVGASQVGILGFSKGGFNTLNAFGLEGEVPGAWVDGAVHEPFEVLEFGVEEELSSMGISFLAPVLVWPAWQLTLLRYKIQYGADLELHRPINTLPKGPDTKRPIHLTQNVNDDTVPQFQSEENVALLESLPEKYEIKGYWKTSEVCNGVSHCVDHITVREEYKQRLCDFWGEIFDYDGCVEAAKAPAKEVKKPEQPEKVDERRLKLANIQV